MSVGFRAAGATSAGGISLTVSQPIDPSVQVGDLILWAVAAQENTRGWGSGISNTGSVPNFTDLSTAPIASVWSGRSQYLQDDGVNPRHWLWLGWRIATVADTGGPTYTATLASAPAFGVGIVSAYAVYTTVNTVTPIYSVAAAVQNANTGATSNTVPAGTAPGGSVGPYVFPVSTTAAAWRAGQTTVIAGLGGDYLAVPFSYGEGGTGVYNQPAGTTLRVTYNALSAPNYMVAFADGFAPGSANLGRLPLLGAG